MTHPFIEMLHTCDLQNRENINFKKLGDTLQVSRMMFLPNKRLISDHIDVPNYKQNPDAINDAISTLIRTIAIKQKDYYDSIRKKKE